MVTQRAILVDRCRDCPYYADDQCECNHEDGGFMIDNPDEVHEDCPLDVISINAMPKNPRYERDCNKRVAV